MKLKIEKILIPALLFLIFMVLTGELLSSIFNQKIPMTVDLPASLSTHSYYENIPIWMKLFTDIYMVSIIVFLLIAILALYKGFVSSIDHHFGNSDASFIKKIIYMRHSMMIPVFFFTLTAWLVFVPREIQTLEDFINMPETPIVVAVGLILLGVYIVTGLVKIMYDEPRDRGLTLSFAMVISVIPMALGAFNWPIILIALGLIYAFQLNAFDYYWIRNISATQFAVSFLGLSLIMTLIVVMTNHFIYDQPTQFLNSLDEAKNTGTVKYLLMTVAVPIANFFGLLHSKNRILGGSGGSGGGFQWKKFNKPKVDEHTEPARPKLQKNIKTQSSNLIKFPGKKKDDQS